MVLPYLLENRASRKSIRIWCAAASSGQEPYTLAMMLKEAQAKLPGWRVEIVGTDISQDILNKAQEGVYSQFEVQRGLPINLLVKYFTQVEDRWKINEEIRRMVSFRKFNLLDSMSGMGQFDVIFCRNVLIYFDQPTKTQVLNQMSGLVANDGFLYLGGAETVLGISDRFMLIPGQRGIYGLAQEQGSVKAAG
jgi:chemotaxis protein methyltransferase CheR